MERRGLGVRGGPHRYSVSLPDGTSTRDILAAVSEVEAVLIELHPLR
jgi:hypothetical protein